MSAQAGTNVEKSTADTTEDDFDTVMHLNQTVGSRILCHTAAPASCCSQSAAAGDVQAVPGESLVVRQSPRTLPERSLDTLAQLAYPLLAAAQGSSIIMMSSVAGGPTSIQVGTPYAMSKASMDQASSAGRLVLRLLSEADLAAWCSSQRPSRASGPARASASTASSPGELQVLAAAAVRSWLCSRGWLCRYTVRPQV